MDPAAWPEIDELLGLALGLPAGERAAFLSERCAGRPAVRAEVEALLDNSGPAETFLETPPELPPDAAATSTLAGLRIGHYRLTGEIGRGGMGVVYRAERADEQFSLQVAVKLLMAPALRGRQQERLQREQQILARLEHPGIARLLDAGVTDQGLPYIVMELVEGQPITTWCNERKLGLRERIELFREVCGAVQFAHRNLVVHRDLKPGNVLVNAQGAPKLLDFGIAKLLSADASAGEDTATAFRAMTVDYASPEQVRGEPATTACDLYSLGVLLYELLTGRRPWRLADQPISEVLRIVGHEEPVKPSVAARQENAFRQLPEDLDSIVLKAMRKLPAERYASAQELSDDLGRYLSGMPVQARRGSFQYLARKFISRYRIQVAAGASIALLLMGSGAAVLRQSRSAAEQRRYGEEQRRMAELERGIAERERIVADEQRRLADQERAVAARERQVAAGERARRRAEVGGIVQSLMLETHDDIARMAGATPVRKKLVERSLAYLDALARETGDRDSQYELAAGYARLAKVQGHPSWANLGDRAGALASYRKARAVLERILRESPAERRARSQFASLLLEMHDIEERPDSLRSLQQAESLIRRALGDSPHDDELQGLLGSAHFALWQFAPDADQALGHLQQALDIYSKRLSAKPEDSGRRRNVALMHKYFAGHYSERDLARMLIHIRAAQALDEKRVAADPGDRLARLDLSFDLSMLADYFRFSGKVPEMAATFQSVVDLRRDLWRADPQDARSRNRLAYAVQRLGLAQIETGDLDSARASLLEAREHAAALPVDDSLSEILAMIAMGMGDIHSRLAEKAPPNSAERRDLHRESCKEYRESLGHLKGERESRYTTASRNELLRKIAPCE